MKNSQLTRTRLSRGGFRPSNATGFGWTSTRLARDVRPMPGPTSLGRSLKTLFTSVFDVRPDGPELGRGKETGGSPGRGPGLTPARPPAL
jgi:hypothetical protein